MVRQPFLFIAGAAPLDFLNTELISGGERLDLLQGEDDLLRWVAEADLGNRMSKKGRWLASSLALRATLRSTFERLADGGPLHPADTRALNEVLAATKGHLRFEFQKLEFVAPETPPFLIARAAAEFLGTADLSLIKRCEGTGCILFFYDTTKSHTRRWCSMAGCGNRMKVAEHYRRRREGGR